MFEDNFPLWIKEEELKTRTQTKRDITVLAVFWIILLGAIFAHNLTGVIRDKTQSLMQAARLSLNEILLVREWNSLHSGVYVRITDAVKPNAYLTDTDRDATTLKGVKLTKINPCFMTREISELSSKRKGPQFSITSLSPKRPENKPTEWEKKALESFEKGNTEVGQIVSSGDGIKFKYMAPLFTKQECLVCHVEQEYKIGDVRGGISVTLSDVPKMDLKNLFLGYLAVGVFGVFIIVVFLGKLDQAYRSLRKQAITDVLTQIPNRRDFVIHINQEFSRSKREKSKLSLIMCDIDNFKAYNDTYGHKSGDECLQMVAGVIENTIRRPSDFCARYGGEEFVVILPGTDIQGAAHLAEKMRANVEKMNLEHKGAPDHKVVTISLGVAIISKFDIVYEDLVKKADFSLYEAKAKGRNRVEIFKPETDKEDND
jgi:diguanylate cyclase (GGDEF)-like protein